MNTAWKTRLAGGAAGAVNGLFGGGGGMVFLPVLAHGGSLPQKKLFATTVAVIFPVCMVSAAVYFFRTEISLLTALPYLAGGLLGGFAGGRLYGKIPPVWLRRLFALFLLYAGARYLL